MRQVLKFTVCTECDGKDDSGICATGNVRVVKTRLCTKCMGGRRALCVVNFHSVVLRRRGTRSDADNRN